MRVCVVGAGGREHALADSFGRRGHDVVVTPGNPGIPGSVATDPLSISADLFVIGPEVPLVAGLADRLRAQDQRVFGPGADGARLEGSKAWMKEVLVEVGVPTARHGVFADRAAAESFLRTLPGPYVVKTDGLAAGKGVLVTDDFDEACDDVAAKLAGAAFGPAGRTVVIEEAMVGPELSLLAVCDGTRAVALSPAQDHKRVGDGDTGPNTGGMGAYSPVALATSTLVEELVDRWIDPTLRVLSARGIDYRGVLYAGLMVTADGPKMIEYNVRFGDPETQVVVPRMTSDLAELLAEAADGSLDQTPTFTTDAAVTVVCAAEGYPGTPRIGDVIDGVAEAEAIEGVAVFCAGVDRDEDGHLVTAGGRVLDVTGVGADLAQARERAYQAIDRISWPGMHFRRDISSGAP